jgi:hypothetical protein
MEQYLTKLFEQRHRPIGNAKIRIEFICCICKLVVVLVQKRSARELHAKFRLSVSIGIVRQIDVLSNGGLACRHIQWPYWHVPPYNGLNNKLVGMHPHTMDSI